MEASEKIDLKIEKSEAWTQPLQRKLREVLLLCGLEETVKWGGATYVAHNQNVVAFGAFKNYVSLWFFEGALLSDPYKILIASSEKTAALRQWRFTSVEEIDAEKVSEYVREAMLNAEQGRKTPIPKVKKPTLPQLLKDALEKEPDVKAFFEKLAPSHQQEYVEYINEAKREETKLRRLEKSMEMMRSGLDLNAKYRK